MSGLWHLMPGTVDLIAALAAIFGTTANLIRPFYLTLRGMLFHAGKDSRHSIGVVPQK